MLVRVLSNGTRKIANLRLPLRSLSDAVSNVALPSDTASTMIPADNMFGSTIISHQDLSDKIAQAAETLAGDIPSSELLLENVRVNGVSVLSAPSNWAPDVWLQYTYQTLLDTVQVATGVPWWGVLVGTACTLRAVSSFSSQLALERLIKDASTKTGMFAARTTERVGLGGLKAMKSESVLQAMKLSSGVSLCFFALPWLNYTAVTGLANIGYTPLVDCSFLWITSLATPDPKTVLGFVNAFLLHALLKRTLKNLPLSEKINQIIFKKKWDFLLIVSALAIQSSMPSCILLFWISSNATSLLLVTPLLQTEWFRNKAHLLRYEERVQVVDKLRPPEKPEDRRVQIATAGKCDVDEVAGKEEELEFLLQKEEFKELETRKARIEELRGSETKSSVSSEVNVQIKEVTAKHTKILNKLNDWVKRNRKDTPRKLEPYDKYLKKKESDLESDLYKKLIEDIEYCEREIIRLEEEQLRFGAE